MDLSPKIFTGGGLDEKKSKKKKRRGAFLSSSGGHSLSLSPLDSSLLAFNSLSFATFSL